ncbi:hypothetical protein SAMN06297251_10291 [Fulvimarina manganoxydans]|uniref:Uncharacterized protein n=1 Tax=Fulvimarina manganoxydans TaxID=937218 RepID=A0A1W1YYL8_9HYPH|nr:hypothetical protein [Fulvimarina manganoxydans]SMC41223.1 hypothetical protein SAMN06297251_10291 [Fulvimarina manganoxydans]
MSGRHTNTAGHIASIGVMITKRGRELANMSPTPNPAADMEITKLVDELNALLERGRAEGRRDAA